ncbi:hypothetical protein DM860_016410 [Cuscuta australis]|uniref:Protein kinase domain-containing protein n=1 Tax=Cuscuta australis TaxID=267555 RepID=A0A328DF60_9ASTE|nr:hypothetical protein DM860_016410 [Cuscuta australis]
MAVLLLHSFLLSIFIWSIPVAPAVDPISESLLALKSQLIDDSNALGDWVLPPELNSSSGFQSSRIHGCLWSGVRCNENSSMVVGLDLSGKNLRGVFTNDQFGAFLGVLDLNLSYNFFSGNLPSGVFNLTSLRSLDVSRNNFSGEFPAGISNLGSLEILDALSNSFSGNLPSEVSKLHSLKRLNFAGSFFSGPIPSEYGSLENIEYIHLAGNSLAGKIPPELGKLKSLTHMEIGYNSYEGIIPWQLGNLSEIQYLDISGANLTGPIPREFGNLTKLTSLFMFGNFLDGFIPEELGRITSLESLDLSVNLLSGPIPETFSELKNLRLLSLMYNEMSGTVQEAIAQLPKLESFHIWSNSFNGSLPESLGRHSKLKEVDVSTNEFTGGIPPGICSGGSLSRLIMFSNGFTGPIGPSVSNCSTLIRVRLENNSFTGEISLNFSNFPDITYLDLSRNRFSGGIPMDLPAASKLKHFNVSYNPELGGIIPEKTWQMLSLKNFSASNCGISGNVPPFQGCKSVSIIDLSVNGLSGAVSESDSHCKDLARVNLSFNHLTGRIPAWLVGLPAVKVVDLSHNRFNGPIPSEFETASETLALLNVSFNDVSGSIPEKFSAMDAGLFQGNPKLCGPPLRACHNGPIRWTQKFARALILCGTIISCITAAMLAGVYMNGWRTVSFDGLHRFRSKDILGSLTDSPPPPGTAPGSVCKAVLPTGITVSVKSIRWGRGRTAIASEFINQLGNARQKNLARLLGFMYRKDVAYLIYDYLPNGNLSEKIAGGKMDWETKVKVVAGIARGLWYLHRECFPPIAHGDLKGSKVVFDEKMEPHLVGFGVSSLSQLDNVNSGELRVVIKEELLYKDIHNFGQLVMDVLTNGRVSKAEVASTPTKPNDDDALLKKVLRENDIPYSNNPIKEEVKRVLDVALFSIRHRASDKPSMQEDPLKLLSSLRVGTRR